MNSKKLPLSIELPILDRVWTFKLLSEEEFKELADNDRERAHVLTDEMVANFNAADFDMDLVAHEIMHIYIDSLCISATRMKVADFEEQICMLYQRYYRDMENNRRFVYQALGGEEKWAPSDI